MPSFCTACYFELLLLLNTILLLCMIEKYCAEFSQIILLDPRFLILSTMDFYPANWLFDFVLSKKFFEIVLLQNLTHKSATG